MIENNVGMDIRVIVVSIVIVFIMGLIVKICLIGFNLLIGDKKVDIIYVKIIWMIGSFIVDRVFMMMF